MPGRTCLMWSLMLHVVPILYLDRIDEANFDATLKNNIKRRSSLSVPYLYFNMCRSLFMGGDTTWLRGDGGWSLLKSFRAQFRSTGLWIGDLTNVQVIYRKYVAVFFTYKCPEGTKVTSGAFAAMAARRLFHSVISINGRRPAHNVLSQLVVGILNDYPEQVFATWNKWTMRFLFLLCSLHEYDVEGEGIWILVMCSSIINWLMIPPDKVWKECPKDMGVDKRKNLITQDKGGR